MAKKVNTVNTGEIDADFIISAFETGGGTGTVQPPATEAPAVADPPTESKEESRSRRKNKQPDYESTFVREVGITARTGKLAYIRREYHDLIIKVVQVIGNNEVSVFSYIDNVLTQHFEAYEDEMSEIHDYINKSPYKRKKQ